MSDQLQRLKEEYGKFTDRFKSLHIASIGSDGSPHCSYAPFVKIDSDYYVYISGLAKHTSNLYFQKKVSLLFIEDESSVEQVFARKRLTYSGEARLVERGSSEFLVACEKFQQRFSKIFSLIQDMADFRMFAISPSGGMFVAGFGLAFAVNGKNPDLFESVRGDGKFFGVPHETETPLTP